MTLFVALINVCNVYAADGIQIIDSKKSEENLFVHKGDFIYLDKSWYDYRFEVSPVKSIGSMKMEAVDSEEYLRVLKEVRFPLEAAGPYKIYFLAYKLKNDTSTLALTFKDNSTVVFGTYFKFSEEKLNQLAVHELGHQIAFRLMNDAKWKKYIKLRGLENSRIYNNHTEVFSNRPQEIFAEDFRLLFGGDAAMKAAHINKDIPTPDKAPGLKDFFLALVKK